MRLMVFIGKFFLFLTIMFILGIPAIQSYLSSPDNALNARDFFTFYLPINLVPFFALVFATPIDKRKMLKLLGVGTAAIFVFNLVIIGLQFTFLDYAGEMFNIYAIGRAAFPFLLWYVFTYNDLKLDNGELPLG